MDFKTSTQFLRIILEEKLSLIISFYEYAIVNQDASLPKRKLDREVAAFIWKTKLSEAVVKYSL